MTHPFAAALLCSLPGGGTGLPQPLDDARPRKNPTTSRVPMGARNAKRAKRRHAANKAARHSRKQRGRK